MALFEAARAAAPVVFATSLISPTGATQVLGGNANLREHRRPAAAADLLPDADGVLRHTLAARSTACPRSPPPWRTSSAHSGGLPRSCTAGGSTSAGRPARSDSLSFAEVLHDHFNPAAVRGKVVVVGATAPVLQDLHSTAAGSPMSGPEVQANAIATALADFPLRSPAEAVTPAADRAPRLLVPLAGVRLGTLGAAAWSAWRVIGAVVAGDAARVRLRQRCSTTATRSPALLLGAGGT